MADHPPLVLVVDDDPSILRLSSFIFRLEGFAVTTAANGEEAISRWVQESPDLVILDLKMPGLDGKSVVSQARERGLEQPVLILSAYGAEEARRELGAEAALPKPFEPDHLVSTVKNLLPDY